MDGSDDVAAAAASVVYQSSTAITAQCGPI